MAEPRPDLSWERKGFRRRMREISVNAGLSLHIVSITVNIILQESLLRPGQTGTPDLTGAGQNSSDLTAATTMVHRVLSALEFTQEYSEIDLGQLNATQREAVAVKRATLSALENRLTDATTVMESLFKHTRAAGRNWRSKSMIQGYCVALLRHNDYETARSIIINVLAWRLECVLRSHLDRLPSDARLREASGRMANAVQLAGDTVDLNDQYVMSVIQALALLGVNDGDVRDTMAEHVKLLSKGWKSSLRVEDDIEGTCLNEDEDLWSNGCRLAARWRILRYLKEHLQACSSAAAASSEASSEGRKIFLRPMSLAPISKLRPISVRIGQTEARGMGLLPPSKNREPIDQRPEWFLEGHPRALLKRSSLGGGGLASHAGMTPSHFATDGHRLSVSFMTKKNCVPGLDGLKERAWSGIPRNEFPVPRGIVRVRRNDADVTSSKVQEYASHNPLNFVAIDPGVRKPIVAVASTAPIDHLRHEVITNHMLDAGNLQDGLCLREMHYRENIRSEQYEKKRRQQNVAYRTAMDHMAGGTRKGTGESFLTWACAALGPALEPRFLELMSTWRGNWNWAALKRRQSYVDKVANEICGLTDGHNGSRKPIVFMGDGWFKGKGFPRKRLLRALAERTTTVLLDERCTSKVCPCLQYELVDRRVHGTGDGGAGDGDEQQGGDAGRPRQHKADHEGGETPPNCVYLSNARWNDRDRLACLNLRQIIKTLALGQHWPQRLNGEAD